MSVDVTGGVRASTAGQRASERSRQHGDALVASLDAALRAAVRREGVDPQRETTRVRRLAEHLVAEHDQRSLTGVVVPVPEPAAMVDELVARVSGFGPLQRLLDDPEVEEVSTKPRAGRHDTSL